MSRAIRTTAGFPGRSSPRLSPPNTVSGGLDSIEIGIGIVGIAPNDTKPIDLDGNGAVDTFAEFSSLGSLIYDVWSGAPFWGEPLWTGYYVFGHGPEGEDADCNCQSDEAIGPSQPPAPPSDPAP